MKQLNKLSIRFLSMGQGLSPLGIEMNEWLNTGPNEPIQKDVLQRLVGILKTRGFILNDWKRDGYGKYAAKLQDRQTNFPFYVVGRGSEIWKYQEREVISIHQELYESWKGAIVLGWLPVGIPTPIFYIFDAELITAYMLEPNEYRPNCYLVNFPFDIVTIWNDNEPILSVWEQYKQKKERLLKQHLTHFVS